MSEQAETRVFRVSSEHYEWADLDDLAAEPPQVPAELRPPFVTGETVDELDDLYVYGHGTTPHFLEGEAAVEATAQEVAQWRAAYADVEKAQQDVRTLLEAAQRVYKAACAQALADLAEATAAWRPVEAELKQRTAALAAKLHEHRTAAEDWKREQETKRQEHLDAVEGPRVIALSQPKRLTSLNKADHIARVHLTDCKHSPQSSRPQPERYTPADMTFNLGLRPGDAWHRLTHPEEWLRTDPGISLGKVDNLRVKFCSTCKPWTAFQEHVEDFPRPLWFTHGNRLGPLHLTDIPSNWEH